MNQEEAHTVKRGQSTLPSVSLKAMCLYGGYCRALLLTGKAEMKDKKITFPWLSVPLHLPVI